MDSTHLFYFKEIAESESLTKAARALHISQPALSKSLSALEKELGRSLFNRVGGRLYLNADGRALLEYANQVDYIFAQINDRFLVRAASPEHLSLYSIGNYFSFIMKNYFQFETRPLNLKVVPNDQIMDALYGGDADAVVADDRFLTSNPGIGLKKIPILSEQLLLMVPKGHELSDLRRVNITDLTGYQIMRLDTNYWLEDIIRDNHVDLNLSWSVDSGTWNYYWSSYSGEVPLSFDTSASFVTQDALKSRRRRCSIVKVEGPGTNRMLYVWYFEKNEERLTDFLSGVKTAFQ